VFKVGVGYLVVAWLVVQVASIGFPTFEAPPWALRAFILVVLLGFPIALLFAWAFEVTPEGVRADPIQRGNKRFVLVTVALIALAFAWYFKGQPTVRDVAASTPPSTPTPAARAPVAAAPAIDPNSIAVLPFVDMSQAKDQEYFSDGLSEELLNLLAQLPQLKVIARTSSFSFKGQEVDIATIAKKLNVANVLEGSVRKSGNTLRITAQLVRTSDSMHLWSQTYDRELTDVFKVQDEIAAAVVEALKLKLLPNQAIGSANRSSNSEAYNQYLLGHGFSERGITGNPQRAAAAYRQAIALDPNYAAAYAELARAEAQIADSSGDEAGKAQSLATAEKAVALAPDLAGAYLSRATIRLSWRRDWTGAKADYERAMALSPADANVQVGYCRLLIAFGRVDEAIAISRKALELDPLSEEGWRLLGRILNASGQLPAAREALDRSLAINPEANRTKYQLGMNELLQGQPQEAMAYFAQTGSSFRSTGIAMAQHSLGNAQASQQALDAVIAESAMGFAYQIAEVYAWRGEPDKAFEWLERAYAQNDGSLPFIKADPLMKSVQSDPRFAAFLRKLGLPE